MVDSVAPYTGWRRYAAFIIDAAIIGIPCFVLLSIFSYTIMQPLAVVGVLYILLRDAFSGRSPGKRAMGLQVVNAVMGNPIGVKKSVIRNIIVILVPIFIIEVLIVLLTPAKLSLGDKIAGTAVVKV